MSSFLNASYSQLHYQSICVLYVLCSVFRLKVFSEGELVVDTGYIIDKTLKGGKVGMYVFSQANVVWSNMSYKCNGR